MTQERAYYKLAEAEELLSCSRDSLLRLARAGMLIIHGQNHGRSVTGASYRALTKRIDAGEDIWAALRAAEQNAEPAPSAPKRTAKARSTKTSKADGGTSRPQKTESESQEFEPLVSKRPGWLKRII